MTTREPGLEVLQEPSSGSVGTAGVGVRYRPDARSGEEVTIDQLWPSGEAEPVYVDNDKLGELIHELMRVHLAVMNDG